MSTKDYAARRYHQRLLVARILLGDCCAICGSIEKLQFDHKNPANKEFTITSSLLGDWSKIRTELAKCQLLCRPCHTNKTLLERGLSRPRGRGRSAEASTYTAKLQLRMPQYLKDQLQDQAIIHHRSLNEEIVQRLQSQCDREQELSQPWSTTQAIHDALHALEPEWDKDNFPLFDDILIDWSSESKPNLYNNSYEKYVG